MHGFRKYFKARAEQSGMKPINIEMLMGHSIGISNSYYKPIENEPQDYLRSEDDLTISHEKRLRRELEKLKVENADNNDAINLYHASCDTFTCSMHKHIPIVQRLISVMSFRRATISV